MQLEIKAVSPIEKKQIFRSVVKVGLRLGLGLGKKWLCLHISLQEMKVSLYNIPKTDLVKLMCVCFMHTYTFPNKSNWNGCSSRGIENVNFYILIGGIADGSMLAQT